MKLGVCYYPEHWPSSDWPAQAQQMRELGLSWVRIGEFDWGIYEPIEGQYRFDRLRQALDTLHTQGLMVIVGTPTACPPQWLINKHPEIKAITHDGQPRQFGSRRHYCFSSVIYQEYTDKIITAMAKAVGSHPAIKAWQLDNEYGCHDTIESYSQAAVAAFRNWCKVRYRSIDVLNKAWGNVFWSMQFSDFDSLTPPQQTVTESNPAHRLAWWRFSSDQVAVFNRRQAQLLRRLCPKTPLLHNYMGRFTQFDHFPVADQLDIATWDSYPLGFLDQRDKSDTFKAHYLRTGDPDFNAFHHDLYRRLGRGRWWVMEQQPGPVNWADHNPCPAPGAVRLWSFEAWAHGAEVVSYFRFQQCPFAQEQRHSALCLADGSAAPVQAELKQLADELTRLPDELPPAQAAVALVFDYHHDAALRIQPQGKNYDPLEVQLSWYSALRQLGLAVDIIHLDDDYQPYQALFLATAAIISPDTAKRLASFNGLLYLGPRTASLTEEYALSLPLAPGEHLQQRIPVRITQVESLRDGVHLPLSSRFGDISAEARRFREHADTNLSPLLVAEDGWGALYHHHNSYYQAALLNPEAQRQIFALALNGIGLTTQSLPHGLRIQQRGAYTIALNFSPNTITLDHAGPFVIGQADLASCDVAIWQHTTPA